MTETRCAFCGTAFDPSQNPTEPGGSPGSCPACGRKPDPAKDPGSTGVSSDFLIQRYFFDLWQIITRPTRFFSRMPLTGGVAGPLAFALIAHWLGSALEFLWRSVLGGHLMDQFGRGLQGMMKMASDVADVDSPGKSALLLEARDRVIYWIWGAGSVILDPFLTVAAILFTAFFVYIGARILVTPGKNGAPQKITFESTLRILCFGMSPAILAAIPFVGGFVSSLCVLIVTVIGGREVYKISTSRSTVVVLFPKLLFLGIILTGVSFIALLLFKLVAAMI